MYERGERAKREERVREREEREREKRERGERDRRRGATNFSIRFSSFLMEAFLGAKALWMR